MADIKISELTAVSSLNNGDLVEVSQVNALAPSGYTSLKASMTDIGKKVNTDIEYTTDLADFEDKTALGAIKETAKDKNVADEYDDTQTYDKGDVVIYKNTLYICTTNNTTGTWDATKWTATTVQSLIGSLSTLTTTDKSSLVGAVNEVNGNLPTWVKQTTGTSSGTIAGASVFGYYYADQWQAYIYLPFVTKNTNYTVNIIAVSADNVGDVTNKCSVVAKQNGYFTVRTTRTMASLPDYYSSCPMRISYSIDFA